MYILLVTYNVYPTTDNFGIKGRECNPLPHTSIYILYIYIYMHTHMWKLSVEQLCHKLLFLYIL